MNTIKQAVGILGLLVAVAGIALDYRWLVWVAIGLLGLSVILRMVISARARRSEEPPETQ